MPTAKRNIPQNGAVVAQRFAPQLPSGQLRNNVEPHAHHRAGKPGKQHGIHMCLAQPAKDEPRGPRNKSGKTNCSASVNPISTPRTTQIAAVSAKLALALFPS